jgi:ankyrin repeat protein
VLLQFGAQVDALTSVSSKKLTALMIACQQGHLKIVTHLVENGARVEARDRFKRTPLIHACISGNGHVVSYLLRLGANPKVVDSSMNSALHYAIAYGWYFCTRLLIEAGGELNVVNSWQTSCLAAGFLKGQFGLCEYLLTEHDADINFKTDDGLTLVMLAASSTISSAAAEQLEYIVVIHKADCSSVDAQGRNALHYLAMNKSNDSTTENRKHCFRMAKILLDHRCEPKQLNSKAQTPLMLALESDNFILVDYLLTELRQDVTAEVSNDGKTLLHYFALKCRQSALVRILLGLRMNDELKTMAQKLDNQSHSAFHYAIEMFDQFCQQNQSTTLTNELQQQYEAIVQMIDFCLDKVNSDPDLPIKPKSSDTESDETFDGPKVETRASLFFLLRSVPSIDRSVKHPLELFLKKTKNVNVLNYRTHRSPLLEAIVLKEKLASDLLISHSSCDINMASSTVPTERNQTPLIMACKNQFLPIVHKLLSQTNCDLFAQDYQRNQALHHFVATGSRTGEYLDVFRSFIEKIRSVKRAALNHQGKAGRSPLHIAVYHNLGTVDAVTDVEQIFVDHECDVLSRDDLGNTPLHNVFLSRKVRDDPVELCVLLMDAMKDKLIDVKNNQGNTPLHLAVVSCRASLSLINRII